MLTLPLALGIAVALGDAPCALPPLLDEGAPFRTGEALTYDLELVLVKAGRLSLIVDRPMAGGALLPLKARAQNTAAFANVRRLTAVGLSWIDPATLRPSRYREEREEDGLRRSTDVRFPGAGGTVTLDQRYRDQKGTRTFQQEGEPLDALSGLYYLRAARLAAGERFCLDLVAAGRYWRVTAEVAAGRERVDTPAGRFETFRVDLVATRADVAPGGKGRTRKMHIWFTTDARRLPVSIVTEIEAGPVSATLSSWSSPPGK
jgi:hypothetical protein